MAMLNYQRVKTCDFCETNANRRIPTNPSCFHVSEQKGISVLTHPHIKNGCSQVSSIPNMVFLVLIHPHITKFETT